MVVKKVRKSMFQDGQLTYWNIELVKSIYTTYSRMIETDLAFLLLLCPSGTL